MKNFILLISLSTFTNLAVGQDFAGQITYEQTFTSKEPQEVTNEMLNVYMGQIHEYFINGGDYFTKTNGLGFNNQLFIGDSLKMFMYKSNSDTVYWHDIQKDTSTFMSYEFFETDKEILGYNVKGLRYKTSSTEATYYYSDQLKLEWKKYSKHKYGHWDKATKLMKSVPLGYLLETEFMTVEAIATDLQQMEEMIGFFKLPENTVLVKNPYMK